MDTRQVKETRASTVSAAYEEEADALSGGCASYDREKSELQYLRSDEDRSSMWGEERRKCCRGGHPDCYPEGGWRCCQY